MKIKIYILLLLSLIVFYCNATNLNVDKDSLVSFKDHNDILSFNYQNDTLFCETINGSLVYNRDHDRWEIFKVDTIFIQKRPSDYGIHYGEVEGLPNGYRHTSYSAVIKERDNWILISQSSSVSLEYDEIIDTLQRRIYRFKYEGIQDFIVEDSIIWIGMNHGLSKININSISRTDYLMLPAFNKISSIHETSDIIYFLDFNYGLFEYHKITKCINPIWDINKYVNMEDFKFTKSCIINNRLFVLGTPIDESGLFLKGKCALFIYDLKNQETIKIDTDLEYLDTFLHLDKFLICYGVWSTSDDGGRNDSGGAIALNLVAGDIIELTNKPIVSLSDSSRYLVATTIKIDWDYTIYEKIRLFVDNKIPVQNQLMQSDSIYRQINYYNKNGDTIVFQGQRFVVNQSRFDEITNLFETLDKQRKTIQDSISTKLMFKPKMIKMKNDNIFFDKY